MPKGESGLVKLSKVSLIKRLSLFQAIVVVALIGTFSFTLSSLITKRIEERAEANLKQQVYVLVNLMSTYHSALAEHANVLNSVFRASLPGEIAVDSEKQVAVGNAQAPLLKAGATILNQNTELVDRFFRTTGSTCSVFVLSAGEFIRIATSIQDEKGNRMTGTLLERTHPAYNELIAGRGFTGKANIAGRDYITSYVPIKNAEGKVIAAVAVAVDFTSGLQKLSEQIVKIKIGKTGYIYALDAAPGKDQGVLRIHPVSPGKNILASKDAHGFEFIRDIIARKEGVSRYFWINQALGEKTAREKIVAFSYLKEWDWVVAAGSYTDELSTEGVFLRNAMLGATLVVVIALVSIFVLMARRWISQPLRRAIEVTDRLASGDFREIAEMRHGEDPTENEVELLERGIYRMGNSLCRLLEKIHDAASELAASSQQISAGASRSSETSQQQSNDTGLVATAMLEMSATVAEVSRHSQQASESAQLAADTAQKGGQIVSETLVTMHSIASSTQKVSARILELGQSSDKIGAILSTITEIAGQTNLLALNAAIEAARAGEQGRGFAVVAGEVRRLAERTAAATQEISGMIGTIQAESRQAVEAMQDESAEVALGVAKTESSGEALVQIVEMARKVGEMVAQIAISATQQNSTAETVNSKVSHMAEMTKLSSINANDTAGACTDLSRLAQNLQAEVGKFKLDDRSGAVQSRLR
jgi:methyl-accepting chemotaxis protein